MNSMMCKIYDPNYLRFDAINNFEMWYFISKIILDNKQNFYELIKLTMTLPFINSEPLIDRSVWNKKIIFLLRRQW